MGTYLKGGKTAPALAQDILAYDPQHPAPSGFNQLTDLPVPNPDGVPLPPTTSADRCRHDWAVREDRTTSKEEIRRKPTVESLFLIVADCTHCRSHLEVRLDFRDAFPGKLICPNPPDIPFHHFAIDQWNKSNGVGNGALHEHGFTCSSSRCPVKLFVSFRPPVIKAEWLPLLTNSGLLEQRRNEAVTQFPERYEGVKTPEPTEVLGLLSTYVTNFLENGDSRPIPAVNKKFKLSLGEDCTPIMTAIGFILRNGSWHPPSKPNGDGKGSTASDQSGFIVDDDQPTKRDTILSHVLRELQILQWQRPAGGAGVLNTPAAFTPQPAKPYLATALGAVGYKKSLKSRTLRLHDKSPPVYAALGCLEDFDDSLLVFAYELQVLRDPENAAVYLECLQAIAEERQSPDLQTKIVMEASCGRVSKKDVRDAYQRLGLEPSLGDDTLAGAFKARIQDAPAQASEARSLLKIIGDDRGSSLLQQLASDSVTTYEDALRFLEVEDSTDIDMIPTMYKFKVEADPNAIHMARHAVILIAEKKKSHGLRSFADTGSLSNGTMDVGEAYRELGIDNREASDDTILAVYQSRITDDPEKVTFYSNCLRRIAEEKDSVLLKHYLGGEAGQEPFQAGDAHSPVGLENIGNTCYFNSLLQFYFSIKPLRELVLDFEKYEMPLDGSNLYKKQVGSREVTPREIRSAKRFVQELRKLFNSMITSPSIQVKPEMELARLALFGASTEDYERRQSIRSTHRPSLGEIDGRPVIGPSGPPAIMAPLSPRKSAPIAEPIPEVDENKDTEITEELIEEDSSSTKAETAGSEKSDETLIGDDEPGQEAPEKEQPSSVFQTPPPTRPPPVPPRLPQSPEVPSVQEQIRIGAQQDVTEVIGNMLFQLQCAIKPESIDKKGEQLDQIKDLFYGIINTYMTNREGATRTNDEYFSDIKINVASGSRDIYAALDETFDVQEVEVGGGMEPQYSTISRLPPVLQFHIQRAQYDLVRKQSFKSANHLELHDVIYLDRYADAMDAEVRSKREECWAWKKEIARLEAAKKELHFDQLGLDAATAIRAAKRFIVQFDEDGRTHCEARAEDGTEVKVPSPEPRFRGDLLDLLEPLAEQAEERKRSINTRIASLQDKILHQFDRYIRLPYRLQSVFIHTGSEVSSGHYWIYIHDFKTDIWRKYNDTYVTEVSDPQAEIFDPPIEGSRAATSYFVCYVQADRQDELAEAVKREIVEEAWGGDDDNAPTGPDGMQGGPEDPMLMDETIATAEDETEDQPMGEGVDEGYGSHEDDENLGTKIVEDASEAEDQQCERPPDWDHGGGIQPMDSTAMTTTSSSYTASRPAPQW